MSGLGYTFRGRNVFGCSKKLYPCVYWPEHPIAQKNGICYIHRIIAYETHGEVMRQKDVHHKNENKDDWEAGNLEPLPPPLHTAQHNEERFGPLLETVCAVCGKQVRVGHPREARNQGGKFYCSNRCHGKGAERIVWPTEDEFDRILESKSVEAIALELGVTGNAVRKHYKLGWYGKQGS